MSESEDLRRTIVEIAQAGVPRRRRLPPGACRLCDATRHVQFAPDHDASPYCESGKHPHCSCDACF